MEFLSWIWTWGILCRCVWTAAPRYSIHNQPALFEAAESACFPGTLTTLATKEELDAVLSIISRNQVKDEFVFWIGLRKAYSKCVDPLAPLRGFQWIQDGSEESEVNRWREEPRKTCTSERCVTLSGQLNGSQVVDWGMVSGKCKSVNQYICKSIDNLETYTAANTKPGPELPPQELPTEATRPEQRQNAETTTATQEPPESETFGPELQPKHEQESQTLVPPYTKTNPDLVNETGSEQGSGPDTMDPPMCKKPHVVSARFLSLDPKYPLRMLVECWPGQQVQVLCSGQPPSWQLHNGSPANFSTVCRRCDRGFQPDGEGNCVDVNECEGGGGSGALCSHSCVNTLGSYRCTCLDQSGQLQEDPALCSGSGALWFRWPMLLLLLLRLLL